MKLPTPTPLDAKLIERAYALLNEQSCFNEDDVQLGSNLERRVEEVEARLRAIGYNGGALMVFYQDKSSEDHVYWAYDTEKLDPEGMRRFLHNL